MEEIPRPPPAKEQCAGHDTGDCLSGKAGLYRRCHLGRSPCGASGGGSASSRSTLCGRCTGCRFRGRCSGQHLSRKGCGRLGREQLAFRLLPQEKDQQHQRAEAVELDALPLVLLHPASDALPGVV